jgi:predicted enzyme related to lactoylglutathione lyase
MSDFNSKNNRAVWFDVPVADLNRAAAFYRAVLAIGVSTADFGGCSIGILDHQDGNGGCLVVNPSEVSANTGILVYFNVDKRIKNAVAQVERHGGSVMQPIHSIGPHGFRAIVKDSEGNRIALHSTTDA